MARIRANNGSGGGGETETLLWTNPSPSSNFPASGISVTVTLAQNISNFDKIRIQYTKAAGFTGDRPMTFDFNVQEFLDSYSTTTYCDLLLGIGNGYGRRVAYAGTNALSFSRCFESGGTNYNVNTCIPLYIWGINGS